MVTFAGAWATSETSLLERTAELSDADYRMRLQAYYEYVFWGGGHVLQIANEIAMVSVWLILLSRVLNKPAVPPKLPSIWNGGWLSKRFGRVDFSSSSLRCLYASSPSRSRA